jgi:FkbM family methyltransferase
LSEELNEQKLAVKYLTGNEKVLEIGGNIGRNSLVIGSILNRQNNSDYVVLESDPHSAALLTENRDLNCLRFHIEDRALSKRQLIQKGWQTIVSEEVLEGYLRVSTVTYEEIVEKYNIVFDTLILDCEGAFYYILQDMPEILQNVQLIIVENDYLDTEHKAYVDSVLKDKGFYVDYVEIGGWGPDTPCYSCFYEVWKTIESNDCSIPGIPKCDEALRI